MYSSKTSCDPRTGTFTTHHKIFKQARNKGKPCLASLKEETKCDGTGGSWSEWSDCKDGKRTRTYRAHQQPKNNGKKCPAPQEESCPTAQLVQENAVCGSMRESILGNVSNIDECMEMAIHPKKRWNHKDKPPYDLIALNLLLPPVTVAKACKMRCDSIRAQTFTP